MLGNHQNVSSIVTLQILASSQACVQDFLLACLPTFPTILRVCGEIDLSALCPANHRCQQSGRGRGGVGVGLVWDSMLVYPGPIGRQGSPYSPQGSSCYLLLLVLGYYNIPYSFAKLCLLFF